MKKSSKQNQEIELHPDAWTRFERAAGAVAKAPPQHRVAKKAKKAKKKTSRVSRRARED
jgi:hypothetical protein